MALTNADLASQVSGLIAKWDTYTKQLRDWLAGTPTGGPYGDGRYPLQNSLGQVFYVPCPAAQAASVDGTVGSALAYATAANASADAAALAKAAAEAAQAITLTYRDAAQAAKTLAETARNEAANSEANALVHRNAAEAAAATATSGATTVTEAAAEVEADRIATEAARVAAEAAAAAAATFDPANFYTKAESDAQYPSASSVWLRGISANGNRALGYSASGDLNLARGFHAVYANGTANRPPSGNGVVWGLSATVGGTDYGVQEQGQLGRRFFRTLFNDAWGDWNEYWHSGNLNLAEVVMTHGAQTITGSKTFQGHILGGTDDWRIYQNTADGADNRRIVVHAGGAVSNSRGAYLMLQGNEYGGGTDAGGAILTSGLNADLSLVAPGSGSVRVVSTTGAFTFNGRDVWHAGNFAPSSYMRVDTSLQQISTTVSDWRIAAQTAAGSDTLALRLQSGGAFNTSRGAILELNGVNAAAYPGAFRLLGAAGTASVINGGTGSVVQFQVSTYEFPSVALFSGVTRFRSGTVGAQRVHTSFGWNDGVQRWTTAMEGDATFSFYNYDTGGSTASRLLNLIGSNMGAARLMTFGEMVGHLEGGAPGQLRMVGGNYGAFFRNDGTNLYLLMTASGDQYGAWNTLRPLTVNVSTGLVTAGNGLAFGSAVGASNTDLSKHIALYGTSYGFSITGSRLNYVAPANARHMFVVNGVDSASVGAANQADTLSVAGGVMTAGPNSVVHVVDRSTSRQWGWYGQADVFRLWNGVSDVLTVDSTGRVSIKGGPLLTQEAGELRIEGSWRSYYRNTILNANNTAWIKQPRIFVGGSDPGAGAEDGDIWIP